MALLEQLQKLKTEQQPQNIGLLDELQKLKSEKEADFTSSRVNKSLQTSAMEIRRELEKQLPEMILPLVQDAISNIRIRDGRDGKDGVNGIDGKDGKNGSPDKPLEVKSKLETLKDEERLDASAIKNLPRVLGQYSKGKSGGGGSTMRVNDLSSQCDGTTKAFTTTNRIGEAHLVIYSSFPTLFLPTTDYTVSGNVVTLGAGVSAPAAGQSLAIIYESSD